MGSLGKRTGGGWRRSLVRGCAATAPLVSALLFLLLPPSALQATPLSLDQYESPFAAVAKKLRPVVVNVNTRKTFEHPPINRSPNEGLFRDPPSSEGEEFQYPSSASGFVFDGAGYVMTNNHVVDNADEIKLQFMNGDEYSAEVVGVDPSTDVAVLRIIGDGLFNSADLGNSDSIHVGDWAIAIGNPFGYLGGSVTVGVISALGRRDLDIAGGSPAYQNFIQTDASINFGNSGGPLCNVGGEVIGMNTAINSSGQGISFAIPINLAMEIADQLIRNGRVVRAYLGILPQELTPDLIEGKGLDVRDGILVGQVVSDTPAERAGFLIGDVITRFNGEPVSDVARFRMLIARSPVGVQSRFDVRRDGKTFLIVAVLAERPDIFTAEAVRDKDPENWLGIRAVNLEDEPEISRNLELDGETGILVLSVEAGSSADRAGLEPGNLIQEMNEKTVRSLDDFFRIRELISDPQKPILLLVRSQGVTRYLAIRP